MVIKLSCGIAGSMKSKIKKELKTILTSYSDHGLVQRVQSYLAIRSFTSIQASSATMSNEGQARKMLTAEILRVVSIMQANIIQRVVHFLLEQILLCQARR